MGQQQLLLLVLSTVIVGLATVAGIQAFSENQQQATQDALIQRATAVASDAMAAHNTPTQMGGVDLTSVSKGSDVADAIGLSTPSGFSADGAGDGASCDINTSGSDGTFSNQSDTDIHIECTSPNGANVEVGVDPGATEEIETDIVSTAS